MKQLNPFYRFSLLLFISLMLNGCLAGSATFTPQEDPYENYNRHAYRLNDTLDKAIFKPVATAYKKVLPYPVIKSIGNFFNNIGQVPTIANDLLQAQFIQATADTWRLAINTTVGIGGLFDVAAHIGLPPHEEDFGLTLAHWGYKNSAYVVLPILGPSTVRDAIGIPIDFEAFSVYTYATPDVISVTERNGLLAWDAVNKRAQLLGYDKVLKQLAFDPYVFERNAYLQRRAALIAQNHSGIVDPYMANEGVTPTYQKP